MHSKIFILSGQSGVGKNTIFKLLEKDLVDFHRVVTCTTRTPRAGEIDGHDYYFLTEGEFKKDIEDGKFLEYAHVHNFIYGTPMSEIKKAETLNQHIFLTIDVQGATKLKKEMPEVITIFLKFPEGDIDQLVRNRIGHDSKRNLPETEIVRRIESAKAEAQYIKFYDYTVENVEGDPQVAVGKIEQIIKDNISSIKIVEAQAQDIPEICSVHKIVWLSTYTGEDYGLNESDILSKDFDSPIKINKWRSTLEDENYKLWLAKDGTKIVGFGGAKKGEHENDFSVIYILPEYQRKGIGQAFANKVFAWLGIDKPIQVELISCNKQALVFYEKLGFTDPRITEPLMFNNGKKVELIKMTKRS
ncbi:MAG: GNAT family N-acetyltransferase [Candidatus Berkelbacteria bacterium]